MLNSYKCPFVLLSAPNIPFQSECRCISGNVKFDLAARTQQRNQNGHSPWWREPLAWIGSTIGLAPRQPNADGSESFSFSWCEQWLLESTTCDPLRCACVLPLVRFSILFSVGCWCLFGAFCWKTTKFWLCEFWRINASRNPKFWPENVSKILASGHSKKPVWQPPTIFRRLIGTYFL